MPEELIAEPFAALGRGNGFPFCVQSAEHLERPSGASENTQYGDCIYSLKDIMYLWWNWHKVSYTSTVTFSEDTTTVTQHELTFKRREFYQFGDDFVAATPMSRGCLTGQGGAGVARQLAAIFTVSSGDGSLFPQIFSNRDLITSGEEEKFRFGYQVDGLFQNQNINAVQGRNAYLLGFPLDEENFNEDPNIDVQTGSFEIEAPHGNIPIYWVASETVPNQGLTITLSDFETEFWEYPKP